FKKQLVDRLGFRGAARRRMEERIQFHPWFYLEPGVFYAEHGNAHDHYSVQSGFFDPAGVSRELKLPLSSQVLHYFANRYTEQTRVDSMQLFYLDRALLALVGLLGAWWAVGAAHGFIAKAAAAVAVGIVFAAVNALLGRMRRTDAHPMLQQAARRVAQLFDVKYVVMGHSHRVVDEPIGGGARYLN